MNRVYLGIDLGTSSVKALCRYMNGECEKTKVNYDDISPDGWYKAVIKAVSELDTSEVAAVGLSSQVGTYIVNGADVISWNDSPGDEELKTIKSKYSKEIFIKETAMPHPDIKSYPIPRLKYIQRKYGDGAEVCQPKDLIGKMLTGGYATDKYSWRGLAHTESGKYSKTFLETVGQPKLPPIIGFTDKLGEITASASKLSGIPEKTPVYTGLNDYFSSLVGMGITNVRDMFDITGTSEHLGIIENGLNADTALVSGPYIDHYVHYGVTASSGASLSFGMDNFGLDDIGLSKSVISSAPIFLPYLNGERAPVFDGDARGVFFGIDSKCGRENLAYAVLEGVAFSVFHIYERLGAPSADKITVSGGASMNKTLNTLKAELFDMTVITLEESDTSALGAAMIAAVGEGEYPDICEAAKEFCVYGESFTPTGNLNELLHKRFNVYKKLYPVLKDMYKKYKEVQL
ncbi:MAG: FGGY-family carbohydrate kinase [Eubacteriales bacterium]|nr:FGGY-family carbohydrate kinase [Eubacteriales bacterium]